MKSTGENRSTREKTCPSATLSTTNPIWTDPESNPGLRGGRPAVNRLSHGTALTCSYICMYINAVAGSVMLCLQHDFYNIIFKIKHKLFIDSRSNPPSPPKKKFGCAPAAFPCGRNVTLSCSLVEGCVFDFSFGHE
jgi:hypothetical protein